MDKTAGKKLKVDAFLLMLSKKYTVLTKENIAGIRAGMVGMKYVLGIPRRPLPRGTVLVHNHVVSQRQLRRNGFRAWTQMLSDDLEVCHCDWAGVDLHGLVHYRASSRAFVR